MASVEAAVSVVARPNLVARLWHWRYELGLIAGGLLGAITIGYTLGLDWLIAVVAAAIAIGITAMVWPPSRQALIARAWCVITPHRIRTGCTHAWIQTRDVLRAACWASDVRVVVNDRRSHIVVLEVIRRLPAGRHAGATPNPAWPHLDRGEADGGDPEEPALYSGLGHMWPFG